MFPSRSSQATSKFIYTKLLWHVFIVGVVLVTGVQQSANAHEAVPPPTQLKYWWPGDGNTKDIAGDLDARLNGGASFGTGIVKQAYRLSGHAQWVSVPSSTNLINFGARNFTIDFWVKFRSLDGEQVMIEKWIQDTNTGWTLTKLDDNRIRFAGGPPEVDLDVLPPSIVADRWYFVALRRLGDVVTIYWNSEALGSISLPPNQSLSAATQLKFGRRGDVRGFFLIGLIDEVEIFRRALRPSEIAAIFGAREAGKIKPSGG